MNMPFRGRPRRALALSVACLVIQSAAALYFIVDGVDDVLGQLSGHPTLAAFMGAFMECLVALALLLAVGVSAHQLRQSLDRARRQDAALHVARGTLADLLEARFAEWKLSASEAEVALFTLKGCTIGEIARMRKTAEGTVRSQLSQVYAKSGLSSQSMLIAHFIEELV